MSMRNSRGTEEEGNDFLEGRPGSLARNMQAGKNARAQVLTFLIARPYTAAHSFILRTPLVGGVRNALFFSGPDYRQMSGAMSQ